jgi:dihydrofolate synthase/folylpolyglutamate synthase
MPASVYTTIASLQAVPVVAGQDFTFAVNGSGDSRWSYEGLHLRLQNLPPSALSGSIQYANAATALAALEALDRFPLNERSVSAALRDVRLPGRFETVQAGSADGRPVEWILDIAHNEAAAAIFATHVAERNAATRETSGRKGQTFAVVGILGDKDAGAIARLVDPVVDHWILCSLDGPRGVSAADLAQRMQLPSLKLTLAASVEEGCERARDTAKPGDRVLVFGSFHTVGPAMRWLGLY